MNPRDYQNMTLPDLATALGCSFEETMYWAVEGMPLCKGTRGGYDFLTCQYWRQGHAVTDKAEERGLTLVPAHKVALGWLMSPANEVEQRGLEVCNLLALYERVGVSMQDGLTAIHLAMGLFAVFEMRSGQKIRPGGQAVTTH